MELRGYVAIGDTRTVARGGATNGSINWLSIPDLASMLFFARLLDADDGGLLAFRPAKGGSAHVVSGRRRGRYCSGVADVDQTVEDAEPEGRTSRRCGDGDGDAE